MVLDVTACAFRLQQKLSREEPQRLHYLPDLSTHAPVDLPTPTLKLSFRKKFARSQHKALVWGWLWVALFGSGMLPGASTEGKYVQVQSVQGSVSLARGKDPAKYAARTNDVLNAGDRLSTGPKSQAQLLWYDRSILHVDQLSLVEIPPIAPKRSRLGFQLLQGLIYFFHRDSPEELEFRTPGVSAVVKGTEFALRVAPDGTTTLSVFEGAVELSDAGGAKATVLKQQQGVAQPGKPLEVRPMVGAANDLIQWFLYYPGVLDVTELPLTDREQSRLGESLAAYALGDLLKARELFGARNDPAPPPESPALRLYEASLLLSVGQVDAAQQLLRLSAEPASADQRMKALSDSLLRMIAVVRNDSPPAAPDSPQLATEWVVQSYFEQSKGHLSAALQAARKATEASPQFGFAWTRVAELEFSHGRIRTASAALDTAIARSPRHAEALALRGFLLGAQNRTREGIAAFTEAIAMDPGLANAWLGRGLCRIRSGDSEQGQVDLLTAASAEPQRASLRSYLGKAFAETGQSKRAQHELELAKELDPRDPTASLYDALLQQRLNRVNAAVRELEQAEDLNSNRRLYRSRLLLDQDRAVASANLATVYHDAGMAELSLREASRAVAADYSSFSSHLFLANSYNALRDPRQIDLRYETPWQSEYLVAALLAPVGGGTLSPYVSQQEYSKFFERDRLGFSSRSDYLSGGDWYQAASLYGQFQNTSFAVDTTYRSEQGEQANGGLEQLNVDLKIKAQLTAQDSLFVKSTYFDATSGDVSALYDPRQSIVGLEVKETQEPILLAGYHHEWNPGHHTLFLAGRLDDSLSVTNPTQSTFWIVRDPDGSIVDSGTVQLQQDYRSRLEIYLAELQQIGEAGNWTWLGGARFQAGEFRTQNTHEVIPFGFPPIFSNSFQGLDQSEENTLERISTYGYVHRELHETLRATVGLSYDRLIYPENYRFAPLSAQESKAEQLSPKAGLIWTPGPRTTFRGAFTRSQGGASLDQSYQLEPSQVAGFQQSFRSLIPESVGSANAGASFETFGLAWDQKFSQSTYLMISGEILNSEVERDLGVLDLTGVRPWRPSQVGESLDYRERVFSVLAHQLVGELWSFGAKYQLIESELQDHFPEFVGSVRDAALEALLHQVKGFAIFTHPSGFFGQFDSVLLAQHNRGYTPELTDDTFWQFNLQAGYRFWQRRIEARVGILNLTDQDYRLNPLNLTARLPRDRTFMASFRFSY